MRNYVRSERPRSKVDRSAAALYLGGVRFPPKRISTLEEQEEMGVRHHIKVLVVDDDPSICKTVGLLLEDHGYSPKTFTEPREARDAADRESFQLALVDLRMPSMDGVEVVEKVGLT